MSCTPVKIPIQDVSDDLSSSLRSEEEEEKEIINQDQDMESIYQE
jgi:hypothetical protein